MSSSVSKSGTLSFSESVSGGGGSGVSGGGSSIAPQECSLFIRATFLLLGFGLLAPWNFVLNSLSYFIGLYKDGGIGGNIPFWMTLAYTYPGLLVQLAFVSSGIRAGSDETRIVVSAAVQGCVLVLVPFLAPSSPWWPVFLMAFLGVGLAVMQLSVSGVAARFPPSAMGSFVLGQGVVGVLSSALQIMLKAAVAKGGDASPKAVQFSAVTYFTFGSLIMAACIFSYRALERSSEGREYLNSASPPASASATATENAESGGEEEGGEAEDDLLTSSSSFSRKGKKSRRNLGPLCSPTIISALKKSSAYTAALTLTFLITFTLFPSVLTQKIEYRGDFGSNFSWLGKNGWWGVILLAVFNVFDTVGRYAAGTAWANKFGSPRNLLFLVTLRLLFVAVFLLFALKFGGPFSGDAVFLAVAALFSVSNGFTASLAFIRGPTADGITAGEKGSTGMILSLALNFGIVAGSNVALCFSGLPSY